MQDQSSETRTCRKCGDTKSLAIFGKHKWGCRACMAADQRERRRQYAIDHAGEPPPIRVRSDATCTRCGVAKSAADFSIHWRKTTWCKRCYARQEAARRLRHGLPTRKVPEHTATHRRCTKCREMKSMSQFPRHKPTARHKTSSTGRLPHCKACMSAKTLAWRLANPDRARAWFRANPDRMRHHSQRRRALELGAEAEPFSDADWREIEALFDHRCAYCWRRPARLAQEHIQPLSRGGAHALLNLVPACTSCNSQKHDKSLLEFLLTR